MSRFAAKPKPVDTLSWIFIVLGSVSLFLLSSKIGYTLGLELNRGYYESLLISMLLGVLGLMRFGYLYLQGVFARSDGHAESVFDDVAHDLQSLSDRLRILEQASPVSSSDITQGDLQEMIAKAIQILPNNVNRITPGALPNSSSSIADAIFHEFNLSKERIKSEINRLVRSGNVNLIIGGGTTVAAVLALSFIVFSSHTVTTNPMEILAQYIPRLSLVILMETFSFFFLRMYRANMLDVKYFQNELTNIEFRFVSMRASILYSDSELLRSLSISFASIERNFLLKKGESTVDIETSKNYGQSDQSFFDGVKWVAETALAVANPEKRKKVVRTSRKRGVSGSNVSPS